MTTRGGSESDLAVGMRVTVSGSVNADLYREHFVPSHPGNKTAVEQGAVGGNAGHYLMFVTFV